MANGPDSDKFEQVREAVARLFDRIREIEVRLERIELSGSRQDAADGTVPPQTHDVRTDVVSLAQEAVVPAGVEDELVEAALVDDGLAADADRQGLTTQGPTAKPPTQQELTDAAIAKLTARQDRGRLSAGSSLRDLGAFEQLVGGRWLTWAGALTMLVAIGFFIPWAWNYFSIPDWLKVAALHLVSFAILAGAYPFYRRGLPMLGQVLAGLGIFAWYGTAFAALRTFDAYEQFFGAWKYEATFAECSVITIVAILLAARTRGVAIVLVGALGGYLNPVLTSSGSGDYIALFTYLAFLNVALVACAVVREWNFLKPLTVVATAIMFALWIADEPDTNAWHLQWLGVLHTLIFWAGVTLPPVVWRRPSHVTDLAALVGSSVGYMGLSWYLFHTWETQQLGLLSWGLTLVHVGLFLWTRVQVTNEDRMPRTHLALAVVFFTLSAPLQLDSFSYLATAWALEGLAFMAIGIFFTDRQMIFSAVVVFVLAAIRLLGFDSHEVPVEFRNWAFDFRAVIFAATGLIMMVSGTMAWWIPRRGRSLLSEASLFTQPTPFELAAAGVALGIGNLLVLAAAACQWDGRLTLVLWTLDMAVIWLVGLRWRLTPVRWYAGTVVAAIVLIRALVHADDYQTPFQLIANARFLSLALLAISLFVVSWGYRRFGIGATRADRSAEDSFGRSPLGMETVVEYIVGTAGHLVLFIAVNMEIHTWFQLARSRTLPPFVKMRMAELATYSIVWALYAAAIVVMGFLLKSRFYRLIGLLAFAPILAKVFLVDLAQLDQLARVLATFALGISLLGVSFLYQKFAAKALGPDRSLVD